AYSWPLTRGHRHTHRDVRVLPLRHGVVTVPTPNERSQERHDGHLAVLHEEAGCVVGLFDNLSVALVGQFSSVNKRRMRASWSGHDFPALQPVAVACHSLLTG